ncbi:MAG: DUF1704 domain-containing protein [Anaerolineae bacterium]|nr:DUF1704 domain-containing protein [Anaerolineae bacterium]
MAQAAKSSPRSITNRFVKTVCARLAENKRVRRNLPEGGRLHIDRQLPFLCVYRRPPRRRDPGTERLILGEASYLRATGSKRLKPGLSKLVENVARTLSPEFGAFLIIEVWAAQPNQRNVTGYNNNPLRPQPAFRLYLSKTHTPVSTVETLTKSLKQMKILKRSARVEVVYSRRRSPPGMSPLLLARQAKALNCFIIGLEVQPVYRHPDTGELYPMVLQTLHRGLSRALKRAFFEFTRVQTTHRPRNYQVLGRRAMVKAVWQVDQQLAAISNSYDFLLQVTPVNVQSAWREFKRSRCQRAPVFHYRPLPLDPALTKRDLFAIHIERIEDPTLAYLFRQKRSEIDRQLTMLLDRDTSKFLYGSLQVYGGVDDNLFQLATSLLETISPRSRDGAGGYVDAKTFANRARDEVKYYREIYPDVSATVQIRDDITGLMVSQGNLLVSSRTQIPVSRIEALLQHEVGTHILTYFNGRAQPFQQLYTGLAGYEALQEGLAVLSEYLVGGLSRPRMRLLAGRVLAVRRLTEGASFVDTFEELSHHYGFAQRTAYIITMRVYRGGGLTKDAAYLKGLVTLLDYLKRGGALEALYIGKITANDLPLIRELQWRQVLGPIPLKPRYLDDPQVVKKIAQLRNGLTVLDLVKRRKK